MGKQATFGSWLKAFRARKGLSTRTLAKELGFSQAYISKLENDVIPPSEKFLAKLVEQYGEIEAYIAAGRLVPASVHKNAQKHFQKRELWFDLENFKPLQEKISALPSEQQRLFVGLMTTEIPFWLARSYFELLNVACDVLLGRFDDKRNLAAVLMDTARLLQTTWQAVKPANSHRDHLAQFLATVLPERDDKEEIAFLLASIYSQFASCKLSIKNSNIILRVTKSLIEALG